MPRLAIDFCGEFCDKCCLHICYLASCGSYVVCNSSRYTVVSKHPNIELLWVICSCDMRRATPT